MDVQEALDLWSAGKMSRDEVLMVTGVRTMSGLYREIEYDLHDRENEAELQEYMLSEIADQNTSELEAKAYDVWWDWLLEEPGYHEACVRMLRHQQRLDRRAIGRQLSKAAAKKIN